MAGKSKELPLDRLWALPEGKRARLLDPAEAEFIAHGFEQASMNRILAAADMSKGQAYYYVKGKSELYYAVCVRALAPLFELMGSFTVALESADAFWSSLEDLFANMIDLLDNDKKLAALARVTYENPQAELALSELMGPVELAFTELLVAGREIGAIRSDLPEGLIGAAIFGAAREIDRWCGQRFHTIKKSEALKLNAAAFEMIKAMAAPLDSW